MTSVSRRLSVLSPTLILALVLSGLVIYLLGRWDQSIDETWETWQRAVDQSLEAGEAYRAHQDSLKRDQEAAEARARELALRVAAQESEITALEREFARDSAASVASSIAELLPRLRLQPIERDLYATDSAGVRFLEGLRLESLKAPIVPVLREQVQSLLLRSTGLETALRLASERADSAGARVVHLEGLLGEGQKLARCHIDPFDLVPCPSRKLSFVLGVGTALVLVAVVP